MKFTTGLGAIALCVSATAASALSFGGGVVNVEYAVAPGNSSNNSLMMDGQFAVEFGGAIGAQIDLGYSHYAGNIANPYYTAGVHLTFNTSPNLMLGAFYFYDASGGSANAYYGVEAMYSTGPVTLEGFVSILDAIDSTFGYTMMGVDARYDLNGPMGLIAGIASAPSNDFSFYYAGISYDVTDAISLEARYGQNVDSSGSYDVVALQFSYAFGDDAKLFRMRNFATMFPTY